MYIAMAGISVNIVLSFVFVRGLCVGLWGLALAASIAANLIAVALLLVLNKRLSLFHLHDACNVLKLIASALIMGVITYYSMGLCTFSNGLLGRLWAVVLPGCVGVAVYLFLIFLFRTDEAKDVMGLLQQKTKKVN